MKACDTFRVPSAQKLRPSDVALTLISAASRKDHAQRPKDELKALDSRSALR